MNTCTNMELNLANGIELNMNEMGMVDGGTHDHYCPATDNGTMAKAMAALASGAVSGSGIANGTHRPGGAIAAAIGGVMGAAASVVNFFFGD